MFFWFFLLSGSSCIDKKIVNNHNPTLTSAVCLSNFQSLTLISNIADLGSSPATLVLDDVIKVCYVLHRCFVVEANVTFLNVTEKWKFYYTKFA